MNTLYIDPSRHRVCTSRVRPPPSKSHTLRALVFALMGKGISQIEGYLPSPDTDAMIRTIEQFGARVERNGAYLRVHGTGGQLIAPKDIIDVGNSGQVLRFMGALAALSPHYAVFTGDESVRKRRPAAPLLDALRQLGAIAYPMGTNGHAPFIIKGPLQAGEARFFGRDSQPVSAMLIATSFLPSASRLIVDEAGELPWVGLTLQWLKKLGAHVTHTDYTTYDVSGGLQYDDFSLKIPGDFSSAAYPVAAALLHKREAVLEGLDRSDAQGDKEVIEHLAAMGGAVFWNEGRLCAQKTEFLCGKNIHIDPIIDALPILSVVGCFSQGITRLTGASSARYKESDRLSAMTRELTKMGARIEEDDSSLTIHNSSLHGAELMSYHDHRIAMALTVAALGAKGPTRIQDCACIAKSYPSFVEDLQSMGFCVEAR